VGITELIFVLILALIIIPPEKLPEVMRTVGKILRELRLASNTVVRELTEAVDDPLGLRQPPPAISRPPITNPPPVKPPPTSPANPDSPS
jgi:Sec-independent protein translocase protein TatA